MLTITVEGSLKPMLEELEEIKARMEPGELLPPLVKSALEEVKASYAAQRDPDGNAWRSLSPEYAAFKARVRGGKPMLHFDETLWSSLGATAEGEVGSLGGADHASAVNADREFLGVSEGHLDDSTDDLLEFVDTGKFPGGAA